MNAKVSEELLSDAAAVYSDAAPQDDRNWLDILMRRTPRKVVRRWQRGRVSVTFRYTSGGLWGRFGGGWNWALGFRSGGRTLLLDLLVCSVTISVDTAKQAVRDA